MVLVDCHRLGDIPLHRRVIYLMYSPTIHFGGKFAWTDIFIVFPSFGIGCARILFISAA
jgi:hypothetical protein